MATLKYSSNVEAIAELIAAVEVALYGHGSKCTVEVHFQKVADPGEEGLLFTSSLLNAAVLVRCRHHGASYWVTPGTHYSANYNPPVFNSQGITNLAGDIGTAVQLILSVVTRGWQVMEKTS